MNGKKELVFLCGARDYHAMDWYKRAVDYMGYSKVSILTDLIESEGFPNLIDKNDRVYKMIVIDFILFRSQSKLGNLWRNFIKLFCIPLQVFFIVRFYRKNKNTIFYAHSMYYILLAYLSGVEFVGRPQGSDILIKPFKSKVYKKLSAAAMESANFIILDSFKMEKVLLERVSRNVNSVVIPNGIDIETIDFFKKSKSLEKVRGNSMLSVRGITPLYRISKILESRRHSNLFDYQLKLVYPFFDKEYATSIKSKLEAQDVDIGMLKKARYYELLLNTFVVISIPSSDSSPRSVFEAIFCGCIVIITHELYYDTLPISMKKRIVIVNLEDVDWLKKALKEAELISKEEFTPTKDDLKAFNEKNTFKKMYEYLYQF